MPWLRSPDPGTDRIRLPKKIDPSIHKKKELYNKLISSKKTVRICAFQVKPSNRGIFRLHKRDAQCDLQKSSPCKQAERERESVFRGRGWTGKGNPFRSHTEQTPPSKQHGPHECRRCGNPPSESTTHTHAANRVRVCLRLRSAEHIPPKEHTEMQQQGTMPWIDILKEEHCAVSHHENTIN